MRPKADTTTTPGGIRYGIVCEGLVQPAWTVGILDALDAVPRAELGLVVVMEGGGSTTSDPSRRTSPATRPRDLTDRLGRVPRIDIGQLGDTDRHPSDAALRRIREEGLDFLVSLLDGPVPATLLDSTLHGVWAFRPGDPTRERCTPPGWWEIYRGDVVTRGALVRLVGRAADEVLHEGCFRTIDDSWVQNRDRLFRGWAHWPARVCREIATGTRRPSAESRTTVDDARTTPAQHGASASPPAADRPTAAQAVRFLGVIGRNYVRNVWREMFRHEKWAIGLVDASLESVMEGVNTDDVRWLDHPGGSCYLADPFGMVHDGRVTILAEEFDFRRPRGTLVALTSARPEGTDTDSDSPILDDLVPNDLVLERVEGMPANPSLHASYPYLLEEDGAIYCVPEVATAGCVRLYRAVRFPLEWEPAATIVPDFAGVDSTVFRHDGRWWVFCTEGAEGWGSTRLHAWHADRLTGPWIPHALNPLKTDVRSSRGAGCPFTWKDRFIRPAQDCSRAYGGRVALNEVLRLTPTEFEERTVSWLEPDPDGPFPHGLHTVSRLGDRLLVDGKRSTFILSAFRAHVARRLRSLLGFGEMRGVRLDVIRPRPRVTASQPGT